MIEKRQGKRMQLVVQSGAEPGRVYDLNEGSLSVGRQSVNEVVVNDEQVSRKHARIDVTPQGIVLTDNNSANGTFVNGTRISTPHVLKAGDTIQFGTTILKMVDNQTNSATIPTGMEQPAPSSYIPPVSSTPSAPYPTSQPQPSAQQPSYGASYNQPQTGYAQPQADGYNPQGGYAPQDYAQASYGQQVAYGQPQAQMPQVTAVEKKKGGSGLLFIGLGALVAIIAILAVLFVFVFSGGGVGDLPSPPNGTKIDIPVSELKNIPGVGSNLDKVKVVTFKSSDNPNSVYSFYKTEMGKKGYTLLGEDPSAVAFGKGDQAAGVVAAPITDDATVASLVQVIPSLKDKIKKGETLILLLSGSKKDFGINN
jgi:FHA domain